MRANGWQGKPIDVFEKFRREFPDGTALEYVEYCYRILEMAVLGPAPIVEWNGAIFNGSWGTERFPDMRAWNEANTDDFLPAFDVATANHLTPDAGYTAGGLDAWMKKSFSETPHPDHPLFKFSNANLQLCAQRLKNWDSQGGINEVKFDAFVSAHLLEWAIPAGHYDQLYTQWAIGHILLVKGTVQLDPDSQTASAGTAGFQELPETAAVTTPPTGFGVEYIRGSDKGGGVGGMLYSKRWVNGAWAAGYALEDARGDVTTKTDANGAVTWQATYEAFGMRTAEAGTNADRQRANTKDEDPTGLLNEGFRYRDLEAGVFISRDPLGFVDGPNVYTYVVQNPWTSFDPEGLFICEARMLGTQSDGGGGEGCGLSDEGAERLVKGAVVVGVATAATVVAWPVIAAGATSVGLPAGGVTTASVLGSGAVGGYAGNATSNAMEGRPLNEGAAKAMVIGAVANAGFYVVGKALGAVFGDFASAEASNSTVLVKETLQKEGQIAMTPEQLERFTAKLTAETSKSAAPVSLPGAAKATGMGPGLETRGLRPAPGTRVRPEGIPEGWTVQPTKSGGGVQYVNPANTNQNVRVMQGNPNSPYPNSQAPYVRQQNAGGTYLRQDGTPSPLPKGGLHDGDAHIPLDQFQFRP